ncbi:MAG: hypothetical protein P1S46_12365, partial [bacterium]|nr:hypothetical protein [bacterium]
AAILNAKIRGNIDPPEDQNTGHQHYHHKKRAPYMLIHTSLLDCGKLVESQLIAVITADHTVYFVARGVQGCTLAEVVSVHIPGLP